MICAMSHPDGMPEVSAFDSQFPVPQFRTLHLLLWIAATAILLTLDIAGDRVFGPVAPRIGPWTTCILHGIHAAVLGAVLTGAGILIRFSRVATIHRLQPGHWMLVNIATIGLFSMLSSPIWRGNCSTGSNASILLVTGVCGVISAALLWYASLQFDTTSRWKASLAWSGTGHLLGGVSFVLMLSAGHPHSVLFSALIFLVLLFLGLATAACALAAVIAFVTAIVTDVRSQCRRDWLHWLGVAAVVIHPVTRAAWQIARWLVLP
jgi:hypothetical protein